MLVSRLVCFLRAAHLFSPVLSSLHPVVMAAQTPTQRRMCGGIDGEDEGCIEHTEELYVN